MKFQFQMSPVTLLQICSYKKLCSVTDCSSADDPVSDTYEGVDATHYFTVILAPQKETYQEFIFILHSDALGK